MFVLCCFVHCLCHYSKEVSSILLRSIFIICKANSRKVNYNYLAAPDGNIGACSTTATDDEGEYDIDNNNDVEEGAITTEDQSNCELNKHETPGE